MVIVKQSRAIFFIVAATRNIAVYFATRAVPITTAEAPDDTFDTWYISPAKAS
jgi:hypothetical protein